MLRSISAKLILLVLGPIVAMLAIVLIFTIRGDDRLIVVQARKMASMIAAQVIADRRHHTEFSGERSARSSDREGYPASGRSPHLMDEIHTPPSSGYRYRVVGRWQIAPEEGRRDPFLARGIARLDEQARQTRAGLAANPSDGLEPCSEITDGEEGRGLRLLVPTVAADQVCVDCHNRHEARPEVIAARARAGVEAGRVVEKNDLLGAVIVEVDLDEVGALARSALATTLLWLSVSGVVALAAAYFFTQRLIARPVRALLRRVRDIAEGEADLTMRIDINRQDEVGELARWFNIFMARLQGLVQNISGRAKTIRSSSGRLSTTARGLAGGAQDTTTQSNQVASAAGEMSITMSSMAGSTEEMSGSIRAVASSVELMTASIGEVARNAAQTAEIADQAAQLAESSNSRIDDLGQAAEEIGKVIGTIQDIA
ncbi:MAG: HAMP domain-containing protein, partial [Planctomycetota bacterium]